MKLVIDENIPAADALFGEFGELCLLPGREITNTVLLDADVLLVRSVTQVNRELLQGTPVGFIGSCTAGVDHIDQGYLEQAGIGFAHAPGANARSVVEYVLSALCRLGIDAERVRPGMTVGIFGLGNVGGRLYRVLTACGFDCIGYDPYLEQQDQMQLATDPGQLLQADIITLHTPLTRIDKHPTYHLISAAELASLRQNAILVNSSRGGVVDNRALVQLLPQRRDLAVVLDVWEHEPLIDLALMNMASLATPHIAGYSYDGKLRGAEMVCQQLRNWRDARPCMVDTQLNETEALPLTGSWHALCKQMLSVYDIAADDRRMRTVLSGAGDYATAFEQLRRDYPLRREAGFVEREGQSSP